MKYLLTEKKNTETNLTLKNQITKIHHSVGRQKKQDPRECGEEK